MTHDLGTWKWVGDVRGGTGATDAGLSARTGSRAAGLFMTPYGNLLKYIMRTTARAIDTGQIVTDSKEFVQLPEATVIARAKPRLMEKHLIYGENNFQQDKSDDYSFQAQRAFSVNNVCQSLSGIGDHGQLSRQEIGALF